MHVLLGSNGHIASQLARRLLAARLPVRVVGRNPEALASLAAAGAQAAIGDISDPVFLKDVFRDARAAYTMIPPCLDADDMRAAQDRIGTAIAQALEAVRVPRVVNLSSIGAELSTGTGPIEALHAQEKRLDAIAGIDLLHLRPGSFMDNLLLVAPVVAQHGVLPGREAALAPIPMVATRDVAAVAASELVMPHRRGVVLLHAGEPLTMHAVAAAIGASIGQPALSYVQSTADQARAEWLQAGCSPDAANQLEALAGWLSTSPVGSTRVAPSLTQPTTLVDFAREVFAPRLSALRRQVSTEQRD